MPSRKSRFGCSNLKRTLAIPTKLAKKICLPTKVHISKVPLKDGTKQDNKSHQRWNENRLKLMKLFKQRELLWNPQHRSYTSDLLCTKAWRQLAKEMNLTVDTCQKLIRRIRESYEFKRKSLTSFQLTKDQPEWFYVAESFLRPFIKQRTPPPPPKVEEPKTDEIKCKDFIISVERAKISASEFAKLRPELELPVEDDEVTNEPTFETVTSKTTCRTCLKTFADNELDQLISMDLKLDDTKSLNEIYLDLIGPAEQRLPSVVCTECAELMRDFYQFRAISLDNAKVYLETVSQVFSEHNYDQPKADEAIEAKENIFIKSEQAFDNTQESSEIFVEPLPTLARNNNIIVTLKEEVPDTVQQEPEEPERLFLDKDDWDALKKKGERPKFFCSICGKHVINKNRHMKTHELKESLPLYEAQCPKCPRNKFSSKTVYENHLKWVHKVNQALKCKFCDLVFSCYSQRTCHQQEVHEQLEYKCPECGKIFKNVRLLRQHQHLVHRPASEGQQHETPCAECGKVFRSRSHMMEHRRRVHMAKRHYCDKCDYSVKTLKTLKHHQRTAHPEDGRIECFKCDHCDQVFQEKRKLQQHIDIVHTKSVQYGCPVCEEKFMYNKQLRQHLDKFHVDYKQPPKGSTLKRVFVDNDDDGRYAESRVVVEEVEIYST